jgi:aspartate/methionine/tyrosine aminotransferase
MAELRDAVASMHDATRDEVIITAGSQGALFSLFHGWLNPGDEMLFPDPGFPAYPTLARICGATAATYELDAADGFRLRAGPVKTAIAARKNVRIVVINHPSNPTGGGTTADDLREIAAACDARGILLISDEVYRDLHFGTRGPTLRDVSRSGVVVSSVSKGFGAPGLRVGWAVGDPKWLDPARAVHNHAVTSAAITSQRAALALLEAADVVLPAAREELSRRWRAIEEGFRRELGVEVKPPVGAFYLWHPLPKTADLTDPIRFATSLRDEARVVVVPGVVFGEAGRAYARISFAAQPDVVAEGVRRLAGRWR